MVKLTVDLIARGTSGYTKKKRDESMQHYLKRLTHLYLEDRGIDEIGDDLSMCRNLIVLYLYDNKLVRVPNLNHNGNLTHLYLQNNQICRLECLSGVRKLQKLYIGGNCITVVEGLERLVNLQELHLEHQKLPSGEKLLFDPRTIVTLRGSLQVLNVSGNNLDSIGDLVHLKGLQQFMASDNQLSDLKEVAHCLTSWRAIFRLELIGNPLCHKSKYRDRVIIMAPSLELLDGKEITETAKLFLKNWQANKDANRRKREISAATRQTSLADGVPGEHDQDLPPLSAGMKNFMNVPGYIMPAMPKKQFQEVLAKSASQPSSAIPGSRSAAHRTHSEVPGANHRRAQSAGREQRYLNTYGTVYHESTGTGAAYRVALVNMGGDAVHGESKPLKHC